MQQVGRRERRVFEQLLEGRRRTRPLGFSDQFLDHGYDLCWLMVCDAEQIFLAAIFVHAVQLLKGQRRKHFEYGCNVQLPLVILRAICFVTVGEYDSGILGDSLTVRDLCSIYCITVAVCCIYEQLQQLCEDAAHAPHVDGLGASDGKLMAREKSSGKQTWLYRPLHRVISGAR